MNNITITKTKPTDEHKAAKARDAKRLDALDTVLAIELALHQDYSEPESLIAHDDLQDAVLTVLGLELPESEYEVFNEINDLMCHWHWRWLTLNSGLDHYYAQPFAYHANMVTLGGGKIVLQADQFFPENVSDVTDNLWEADFARSLLEEKWSVDPHNETGRYSDQALLSAFSKAHLINPIPEGFH